MMALITSDCAPSRCVMGSPIIELVRFRLVELVRLRVIQLVGLRFQFRVHV